MPLTLVELGPISAPTRTGAVLTEMKEALQQNDHEVAMQRLVFTRKIVETRKAVALKVHASVHSFEPSRNCAVGIRLIFSPIGGAVAL